MHVKRLLLVWAWQLMGPLWDPVIQWRIAAQTLSVHGDESDDEVLVNEESLPPTAVVLGNGASEQVGGIPLPIGPLVYNVAREGRSTGSDEAGILHCTWKL
jgi:hypothetical protein